MVADTQESLDLTPKKKGGNIFGCCMPKAPPEVQPTELTEEEPDTQDRAFDLPELGDEPTESKQEPKKVPNNFVVAFWEFLLTFVLLGMTDSGKANLRHRKALVPDPEAEEAKAQAASSKDKEEVTSEAATTATDEIPNMTNVE